MFFQKYIDRNNLWIEFGTWEVQRLNSIKFDNLIWVDPTIEFDRVGDDLIWRMKSLTFEPGLLFHKCFKNNTILWIIVRTRHVYSFICLLLLFIGQNMPLW